MDKCASTSDVAASESYKGGIYDLDLKYPSGNSADTRKTSAQLIEDMLLVHRASSTGLAVFVGTNCHGKRRQ